MTGGRWRRISERVYGYTGGRDIYGESGDPTKRRSIWNIDHAI